MTDILSHVGLVIDEKYQIDSKLGAGGMATVYQATRLMIGDTVAIKILHPEQVRDPQSMERFRREAQAAARLKHPNAVNIYDFGVSTDGLVYLVMEIVEGKNIRTMIREQGPMTPRMAGEILMQACAALEAAHKQNIVHRDIKPDNIVVDVTPTGVRVKVLDFGIAWMRDMATASLTQTGNVIGTPHYMSPEQCLGEELDSRSDIYSMGVVLFEMLAGVVPFNSPTSTAVIIQHVNQAPPPLRVINISVPPAVESVVLHALSKRREDRPQSAHLLAQELNDAIGGKAPVLGKAEISAHDGVAPTLKMSMPDWSGATQPAQLSGRRAPRSQRPWIWMAAAGVPLLAVAGWFLYSSTTSGDSTAEAPRQIVKQAGTDSSGHGVSNGASSVATNSAGAIALAGDRQNAGENARRSSYLNVSSLPSKVEFVVYAASSRGAPMNAFAAEVARSLRTHGKTASASVFSPAFVTTGGFNSFFNGSGGPEIRASPLSTMGNRLLLARVDVSLEATQGTTVEGLVTARVSATFAVISTKDGSVVDSFELNSVVAGVSKDAATSSALDRILENLGDRGY